MLKGKKILLGITGGIAAYKMANVASMLVKLNADVHVVMTENASKFIPAETFQVLTKNKVYLDCFDENPDDYINVPHVSLGTSADCILIAPATADIIGKIANGIADDMVTTSILPAQCPVLIAPSMNVYMFQNAIVQDNIEKLRRFGYHIIEPDSGHLACGYDGKGKLPDEETLVQNILMYTAKKHDLKGKKILVNAGPTEEPIDPVRIITNHSSGKMGYSVARMAAYRGAEVTLVSGPVNEKTPLGVVKIPVVTADEMYHAMIEHAAESDAVICAAAVADYTPETVAENKIKKHDDKMSIPLKRTRDILKNIGENKSDGQFLCGFSMETENMINNSKEKLKSKNANMICANNLKVPGAGYKVDTNILTLIENDKITELPIMSKDEAADKILDCIKAFFELSRKQVKVIEEADIDS